MNVYRSLAILTAFFLSSLSIHSNEASLISDLLGAREACIVFPSIGKSRAAWRCDVNEITTTVDGDTFEITNDLYGQPSERFYGDINATSDGTGAQVLLRSLTTLNRCYTLTTCRTPEEPLPILEVMFRDRQNDFSYQGGFLLSKTPGGKDVSAGLLGLMGANRVYDEGRLHLFNMNNCHWAALETGLISQFGAELNNDPGALHIIALDGGERCQR